MEVLALLLVWPALIVVIGLVFISLADSFVYTGLMFPAFILLLVFIFGLRKQLIPAKPQNTLEELEQYRRGAIAFSIALLIPIFFRYFITFFDTSLISVVVGLACGFGVLMVGMFVKRNKVIMYSNLFGGALTILYLYSKIWGLGQLARVIATAFGLVVAVVVAVIKLKDKLK